MSNERRWVAIQVAATDNKWGWAVHDTNKVIASDLTQDEAELIALAPALLTTCRAVESDFDAANREKYDELRWESFCKSGGFSALRSILAKAERSSGPCQ